MDRFADQASNLRWPFSLPFIAQKFNDACATQFPAHILSQNLFVPFEKLSDIQLEEFLSLSEIGEVIGLANNLLPKAFSSLQYDIRQVKHEGPALKLADFGFDIWIETKLAGVPSKLVPFPLNKTVEQVIEGLLAPKLYKNIEKIIFQDLSNTIKVEVHGDTSLLLDNKNWKDKKYKNLRVVLRPTL